MRIHCKEETEREIKHWKNSLLDSCGSALLRLWMEMLNMWILYITKSPDKPMGNVTGHWSRFELQDPKAIGNLPHMHTAIWTDDDVTTQEGLFAASDRIRGCIEDFVRPNEKKKNILRKRFSTPKVNSQNSKNFSSGFFHINTNAVVAQCQKSQELHLF